MKVCENCQSLITTTFGSGRFCCMRCSRAFSTKHSRSEINQKVSKKLAGQSSPSKGKPSPLKGRSRPLDIVAEAVRIRSENRRKKNALLPFDQLSNTAKRERIFEEQNGVCAICSIPPMWNGSKLIFQLDHIKGRQHGDERNNLRLICPNCHSQTETFTSKNASPAGRVRMAREAGFEPTNTTSKAVVLPLN